MASSMPGHFLPPVSPVGSFDEELGSMYAGGALNAPDFGMPADDDDEPLCDYCGDIPQMEGSVYCSKECARFAGADSVPSSPPPPAFDDSPPASPPSVPVVRSMPPKAVLPPRPIPTCGLSSCSKPPVDNGYCSEEHAKKAVTTGEVSGCASCLKMPRRPGNAYCSDVCEVRANPNSPAAQNLGTLGGPGNDDLIRARFMRRWSDTKGLKPNIQKVQEVAIRSNIQKKFDACTEEFNRRGGYNIKSTWYGALCTCGLASKDPMSKPCQQPTCKVCPIIRHGFNNESHLIDGAMGPGIYSRENPAHAHPFAQSLTDRKIHVLILCSIAIPKSNDVKSTDPVIDKEGRAYCPSSACILPRWIIVYSVGTNVPDSSPRLPRTNGFSPVAPDGSGDPKDRRIYELEREIQALQMELVAANAKVELLTSMVGDGVGSPSARRRTQFGASPRDDDDDDDDGDLPDLPGGADKPRFKFWSRDDHSTPFRRKDSHRKGRRSEGGARASVDDDDDLPDFPGGAKGDLPDLPPGPIKKPGPGCKLPGCTKTVHGDGAKYCSNEHRKEAVSRGLAVACIMCKEYPKLKGHFCGTRCVGKAESSAPFVISIDPTDPKFKDVSDQFAKSWRHSNKAQPTVVGVFKVIMKKSLNDAYRTYQQKVEAEGNFRAAGKSEGNECRRWHGTRRACTIGDSPTDNKICNQTNCALCRILEKSFQVALTGTAPGRSFNRFGIGIYASSTSSKSDDYQQNVTVSSPNRCILLTTVIVGKGHKLTQDATALTGAPPGFHSVLGESGGSLNYDEVVVYDNDAIRPSWLVIYK